jgi:general secretion pathway protein D
MMKKIILLLALINLSACASLMEDRDERLTVVEGHVDTPLPTAEQADLGIPPVVEQVPIIAAPEPAEPLQTFTVVATDLPASELLFAQILKRVSRQVELRYYLDGPNLVVEKDRPFVRQYRIDYLNMSRVTTSSVGIETALGGDEDTGSTGDSETTVTNDSSNEFWKSLEDNFALMASSGRFEGTVISNRESGTISVMATSAAHENIQRFVDSVMGSARRQVLIEATVVEITLNDEFQAGVDWSRIAVGDGWDVEVQTLAGALGTEPFTSATYNNSNSDRDISGAIKALDAFGDVSVMSSPKIMALNNQTSILKVADNIVYFEIDATSDTDEGVTTRTFDTTAKTVPVGFVMNVTPFITADDEVMLNIRPTITRLLRFVNDPNPALADANVESLIPEIQVREMESVLRVTSGNTAVIGGLMQDTASRDDRGLPGLHDAKGFGILFGSKQREFEKTELVIFLRPRILDNANIDTNLSDFKKFLKPDAFSGNAE